MQLLFIDTNIYLEFYNSKNSNLKKLLTTLFDIKDNIFITDQIVDEINRNKLISFMRSCEIKPLNQIVQMAPHFESKDDKVLEEYNSEIRDLNSKLKKLDKSKEVLILKMLNDISKSKDSISVKLEEIFFRNRKSNNEIIELAKQRKQKGNPPGKKEDHLGDEINWELLLTEVNQIKTLWIITKDQDYFSYYKDTLYLNPYLHKELRKYNPSLEINIYNELGTALIDFNKKSPISSLPDKQTMNDIIKEEKRDVFAPRFIKSIALIPDICPQCSRLNTFKIAGLAASTDGENRIYYCKCYSCGFSESYLES